MEDGRNSTCRLGCGPTKNGSVAARPRGVTLIREYTSAEGVAGQMQPLVSQSLYRLTFLAFESSHTLQASRHSGRALYDPSS